MTEYVLDAHALVWMLEGNAKLGTAARAVLDDPKAALLLPATALAEACWVVGKGRTSLADWREIVVAVGADTRLRVVPLDAAIVERAMSLVAPLEMHDAQIVATVLIQSGSGNDVRLLTRDKRIVDSRLVRVVW